MTGAQLATLIETYGFILADSWRYRKDIMQPPPLIALDMHWIAADMLYGGD